MNIEIRRARYTAKHAALLTDRKNLRDCRAWWRITEAEYKKEMAQNTRALAKLAKANPDLDAEWRKQTGRV
jgi:hypothetical protein